MTRRMANALIAAPALLALLGCLIPLDEGGDPDEDGYTPPPPYEYEPRPPETSPDNPPVMRPPPTLPEYDPDTHDARDNPNHPNYRGSFSVSFEADDRFTLDALRLGYATFSPVDAAEEPAHCLITLADLRPDALGRLGYLVFQSFDSPQCDFADEVQAPLRDATRALAREGQGVALKSARVEQERTDLFVETAYGEPQGWIALSSARDQRATGTMRFTLRAQQVDGGPWAPAEIVVEGAFELIGE